MRKPVRIVVDDSGATAVEYALMVALIAIVIAGAVTILGSKVGSVFMGFASNPKW